MSDRILAEAAQRAAIVEVLRHVQAAGLPEFLETRRRKSLCRERGAGRLIEMRQPLPCRAAFSEIVAGSETFGKIGEYLIVIARKAERLIAQLPHGPSPAATMRRGLAVACYRLATWLDAPAGYVQLPDVGPEDWVTPWAGV